MLWIRTVFFFKESQLLSIYQHRESSWQREHPVWRLWVGRVPYLLRNIKKTSVSGLLISMLIKPDVLEQWFSSPGKLLELQILGFFLGATESETQGMGSKNLFLSCPSGDSAAQDRLRTPGLDWAQLSRRRAVRRKAGDWSLITGACRLWSGLLIVNFMRQLGWATVPRYLVKHYSGCFWEDVLGWPLYLNCGTLHKVQCPPKWGE